MKLRRFKANEYGIFGKLETDDGEHVAFTLEHAYPAPEEPRPWIAKVDIGSYECQRGWHVLPNQKKLETFEVTDVPGHTGILFHLGNKQEDSDGCILLGYAMGPEFLMSSSYAFGCFMARLMGLNTFQLQITEIF